MYKYFLSLAAIIGAVAFFSFKQSDKPVFETRYFRYTADNLDFNSLKSNANWDEISLPITDCSPGELPCVVSVDNLQDYGGIYSPGVIDEVDFAHFLELQGSTSAEDYVTGTHQEASKE